MNINYLGVNMLLLALSFIIFGLLCAFVAYTYVKYNIFGIVILEGSSWRIYNTYSDDSSISSTEYITASSTENINI